MLPSFNITCKKKNKKNAVNYSWQNTKLPRKFLLNKTTANVTACNEFLIPHPPLKRNA